MDRTYSKAELDYLNTKYGSGWIRYPEKKDKDYVLYEQEMQIYLVEFMLHYQKVHLVMKIK